METVSSGPERIISWDTEVSERYSWSCSLSNVPVFPITVTITTRNGSELLQVGSTVTAKCRAWDMNTRSAENIA